MSSGRNKPAAIYQKNQGASRFEVLREIAHFEQELSTFEDSALSTQVNEKKKKGRKWWPSFLSFPIPHRIYEIESTAIRAFSPEKFAFFMEKQAHVKEDEEEEGQVEKVEEPTENAGRNRKRNKNKEEKSEMASPQPPIREENEEKTAETEEKDNEEWKMQECFVFCLKQLFFSRIWIFILQLIASFWAGNRFRTDAFYLAETIVSAHQSPMGAFMLRFLFAGLRRWDSQHFLFIADNHYILEQSLAFFPGFPEIITVIRTGITEVSENGEAADVIPTWLITGVLAVVLNFFFFIFSGIVLFLVTFMIGRSVKKSLLATSLFAFNPASIFFSAAYSESMYFCLTLTGFSIMVFSARACSRAARYGGALFGTIVFGLSLVVRSNGLLNIFFAAWYFAGAFLWEMAPPIGDLKEPGKLKKLDEFLGKHQKNRQDEQFRHGEAKTKKREIERSLTRPRKVFVLSDRRFSRCFYLFLGVLIASVSVFLFVFPFGLMSHSVVAEFCNPTPPRAKAVRDLKMATKMDDSVVTIVEARRGKVDWCKPPKTMAEFVYGLVFPPYYKVVQAKYWDVGLFGYWQFRKIPCFLMMLPAAILTIIAIKHTKEDVAKKGWTNIWVLFGRTDHLVPMAIHSSIVLFTAVFIINAEVFTRLIFSSSPFLYLFLADYLDGLTQGDTPGNRFWHYEQAVGILPFFVFKSVWKSGWAGKSLYIYLLGYFVFGTMAHAAWLPFT
ncbi:unnamed protein product [Caenorhabditis sp. 36 PRJEB53466]|nr:unnamed protein product [Caenorhabditis sp. 36 PRJEB53466]